MLDNITCTVCYMKLCYKLHHTKLNNSKKRRNWMIMPRNLYIFELLIDSLQWLLLNRFCSCCFSYLEYFFSLVLLLTWDQSFITFAKFSKKLTFLTTWYAHVRFCTCLMFANVVNEWSPFILCFVAVPSRVFKGWKSEVLYCFMAKSC